MDTGMIVDRRAMVCAYFSALTVQIVCCIDIEMVNTKPVSIKSGEDHLSRERSGFQQKCLRMLELARGIEPPTCGLQNPTEANLPSQQTPDKIGESLDGSQY